MKIKANLSIVLDVPEDQAKKIINEQDLSAFLATIYTPNETRGKWWIEGEQTIPAFGIKHDVH